MSVKRLCLRCPEPGFVALTYELLCQHMRETHGLTEREVGCSRETGFGYRCTDFRRANYYRAFSLDGLPLLRVEVVEERSP